MSGKYVTQEEKDLWRAQLDGGWSRKEIAAASPRAASTIRRHIPKYVSPYGPRDNPDYKKRWREANKERERATTKKYREANREKRRKYDRERYQRKRHKANGSPPPTNGRSCRCSSPLGEIGEPCGWCGDTIHA